MRTDIVYAIVGTDFNGNKKTFSVVADAAQAEKYAEMLANGYLSEFYTFSIEKEVLK